jgi:hypothetical protein
MSRTTNEGQELIENFKKCRAKSIDQYRESVAKIAEFTQTFTDLASSPIENRNKIVKMCQLKRDGFLKFKHANYELQKLTKTTSNEFTEQLELIQTLEKNTLLLAEALHQSLQDILLLLQETSSHNEVL